MIHDKIRAKMLKVLWLPFMFYLEILADYFNSKFLIVNFFILIFVRREPPLHESERKRRSKISLILIGNPVDTRPIDAGINYIFFK